MSDPDLPPPTIEHAGLLEDLSATPGWILPHPEGSPHPLDGRYSCAFCGVGDSATVRVRKVTQ